MTFSCVQVKKAGNTLEAALVHQAQRLAANPEDCADLLQLYTALSIYKCSITGQFRGDPDRTQVNLFKKNRLFGIRIYRIGHTDTAIITQKNA